MVNRETPRVAAMWAWVGSLPPGPAWSAASRRGLGGADPGAGVVAAGADGYHASRAQVIARGGSDGAISSLPMARMRPS